MTRATAVAPLPTLVLGSAPGQGPLSWGGGAAAPVDAAKASALGLTPSTRTRVMAWFEAVPSTEWPDVEALAMFESEAASLLARLRRELAGRARVRYRPAHTRAVRAGRAPGDADEPQEAPVGLHYTPLHGRFGDPKPVMHEGRAHVYFQNSPRPDGFDAMRWAHVVSDDLLRWTALPDALIPDPGGPDAYGCWTGCVLRHEGRFHVFYTGVAEPGGRVQTVCHAESDDLIGWRKDPANPVVRPGAPFATGPESAWRDPQIRTLPEGGFEMVLTAEVARGPRALRGCMARLTSPDLRHWRIDGVLHHPGDVHRCECPEVVPWDGRLALMYSAFGVEARVADAATGPWERPAAALLDDFRWYGAKTTLDGARRLTFGFVFDRIAPRDTAPHDGCPWTWGGVMGFPRELTKGPDGAPALRPVEELDALRVAAVSWAPDLEGARGHWQVRARGADTEIVGEARPGREELAVLRMGRHPRQVELGLHVTWGPSGSLGLVLQADADLGTGYHVVLDRARADVSLRRLIPHANPASPYLQRMPLPHDLGDRVTLRALLDRTLLELYIDDRVVFTSRLYQRPADAWWGLTTRGAVRVRDLECWRLERPEAG